MNKRGFTLIELVTTFALSSLIIILLTNVVLIIKNIYFKNDVRTKLLIEQGTLSHLMNKKMAYNLFSSFDVCADVNYCFEFNFVDGSISKLIVGDDFITFDNYEYIPIDGTTIEVPTVETIDDSFLVIKIPIKNKLYPDENFGIDIVYQFNL